MFSILHLNYRPIYYDFKYKQSNIVYKNMIYSFLTINTFLYAEIYFGTGKNPGFLVGRNLALNLIAALRIFAIFEVDVPLKLFFL